MESVESGTVKISIQFSLYYHIWDSLRLCILSHSENVNEAMQWHHWVLALVAVYSSKVFREKIFSCKKKIGLIVNLLICQSIRIFQAVFASVISSIISCLI